MTEEPDELDWDYCPGSHLFDEFGDCLECPAIQSSDELLGEQWK